MLSSVVLWPLSRLLHSRIPYVSPFLPVGGGIRRPFSYRTPILSPLFVRLLWPPLTTVGQRSPGDRLDPACPACLDGPLLTHPPLVPELKCLWDWSGCTLPLVPELKCPWDWSGLRL